MILTKITGTTFGKRQDTINMLITRGILVKDALVSIIPEPECKFDENARRCEVEGYTIGYLDRECAEICKVMAEKGIYFIGVVDWVGSFNGQTGIRILLKKMG